MVPLNGAENGNAVQPHSNVGAHGDADHFGGGDRGWTATRGDLVAALHRTRVTLAGTATSGHWVSGNSDAARHSEGRDERDKGFVKHGVKTIWRRW